MHPSLTPIAGLPVADMQRIDAACDRFESAWRAGERPRMARDVALVEPGQIEEHALSPGENLTRWLPRAC